MTLLIGIITLREKMIIPGVILSVLSVLLYIDYRNRKKHGQNKNK